MVGLRRVDGAKAVVDAVVRVMAVGHGDGVSTLRSIPTHSLKCCLVYVMGDRYRPFHGI